MSHFADAPVDMRSELGDALDTAWRRLGEVGSWLTAGQRLDVAAEARAAWDCPRCIAARESLSVAAVVGDHTTVTDLPDPWVEVIHRVVTDSGRLTRSWAMGLQAAGIGEEELVEIITVTILTTVVDAYALAVGLAVPALPDAAAGEPARERRADAFPGPGWVSTIAPERAAPDFVDFYDNESHFHIRRALTLTPDECRWLWDLLNVLYLEDPRIHELDGHERGITRAQMEFLAARASMLLDCYY